MFVLVRWMMVLMLLSELVLMVFWVGFYVISSVFLVGVCIRWIGWWLVWLRVVTSVLLMRLFVLVIVTFMVFFLFGLLG